MESCYHELDKIAEKVICLPIRFRSTVPWVKIHIFSMPTFIN